MVYIGIVGPLEGTMGYMRQVLLILEGNPTSFQSVGYIMDILCFIWMNPLTLHTAMEDGEETVRGLNGSVVLWYSKE